MSRAIVDIVARACGRERRNEKYLRPPKREPERLIPPILTAAGARNEGDVYLEDNAGRAGGAPHSSRDVAAVRHAGYLP